MEEQSLLFRLKGVGGNSVPREVLGRSEVEGVVVVVVRSNSNSSSSKPDVVAPISSHPTISTSLVSSLSSTTGNLQPAIPPFESFTTSSMNFFAGEGSLVWFPPRRWISSGSEEKGATFSLHWDILSFPPAPAGKAGPSID